MGERVLRCLDVGEVGVEVAAGGFGLAVGLSQQAAEPAEPGGLDPAGPAFQHARVSVEFSFGLNQASGVDGGGDPGGQDPAMGAESGQLLHVMAGAERLSRASRAL